MTDQNEAIELENIVHAAQITDKWVAILEIGFHPDTHGADYTPALRADLVAEYDRDMNKLFEVTSDPYQAALDAWERAGLTEAYEAASNL